MAVLAEVGILMPLGIVLMSVGRGREGAPRSLVRELGSATLANPIVLGVCAGAVLGLTGTRLPQPVDCFLSFLGPRPVPPRSSPWAGRSPVAAWASTGAPRWAWRR